LINSNNVCVVTLPPIDVLTSFSGNFANRHTQIVRNKSNLAVNEKGLINITKKKVAKENLTTGKVFEFSLKSG